MAARFRHGARIGFFVGIVVVAVLSITPQDLLPKVNLWDKLEHLSAYAMLALLAGAGFPNARSRWRAALSLIAIGCALEVAQAYVPGRLADALDALANAIGVGVGLTATAGIECAMALGARRSVVSSRR